MTDLPKAVDLLVVNGSSRRNLGRMALLKGTKLDELLEALTERRELISLIHIPL